MSMVEERLSRMSARDVGRLGYRNQTYNEGIDCRLMSVDWYTKYAHHTYYMLCSADND
jgi:hypothetical protein